jgi:hypothetical protein
MSSPYSEMPLVSGEYVVTMVQTGSNNFSDDEYFVVITNLGSVWNLILDKNKSTWESAMSHG